MQTRLRAAPAVVSVYTSRIQQAYYGRGRNGLEDILRQFGYQLPVPQAAPEPEREVLGVGSGVILSEDGYIITNNHVIRDERGEVDEILVRLSDGTGYVAQRIGADPKTDVAVIKIEADQKRSRLRLLTAIPCGWEMWCLRLVVRSGTIRR